MADFPLCGFLPKSFVSLSNSDWVSNIWCLSHEADVYIQMQRQCSGVNQTPQHRFISWFSPSVHFYPRALGQLTLILQRSGANIWCLNSRSVVYKQIQPGKQHVSSFDGSYSRWLRDFRIFLMSRTSAVFSSPGSAPGGSMQTLKQLTLLLGEQHLRKWISLIRQQCEQRYK